MENISWAHSRGAKNALFSFNMMVILKESLEQNISQNIMATNTKRALATAQKVITMRIKGGTTKMGRVKKRYTQPVSKRTGELTTNNSKAQVRIRNGLQPRASKLTSVYGVEMSMVPGSGSIKQLMELVSIQGSLQGMLSRRIWWRPIRQIVLKMLKGQLHTRDGVGVKVLKAAPREQLLI